jgi:hypothetical protein
MCGRAVFSEGDAARPITASQPPVRACKTSKHYRSRWQGRSCPRLLKRAFSGEAKQVSAPARAQGSQTRQSRLSLGRPLVRAFHKGTTGPRSGGPFRLVLVFCGAARLTVASHRAVQHAVPCELSAVLDAAPCEPCAGLDGAPSPPSGRQPVTDLMAEVLRKRTSDLNSASHRDRVVLAAQSIAVQLGASARVQDFTSAAHKAG